MARLLMLVAIVVLIYLLVRSFRKAAPASRDDQNVENMVRCSQCGVHFPKGESFFSDGRYFCSIEHRDEYRK